MEGRTVVAAASAAAAAVKHKSERVTTVGEGQSTRNESGK